MVDESRKEHLMELQKLCYFFFVVLDFENLILMWVQGHFIPHKAQNAQK